MRIVTDGSEVARGMQAAATPEAGSIWRDGVTGESCIVQSHEDKVNIGKNPDGTLFPYGRQHFILATPSNGILWVGGIEEFRKRFVEQIEHGLGSEVLE